MQKKIFILYFIVKAYTSHVVHQFCPWAKWHGAGYYCIDHGEINSGVYSCNYRGQENPELIELCDHGCVENGYTNEVHCTHTHPIVLASQDCIHDGIRYQNGDSLGGIGIFCKDHDLFIGLHTFCHDGIIANQPFMSSCASLGAEFHCCQSGETGTLGAAKCITGVCENQLSQCKENEEWTDCYSSSCWEGTCDNPVVGPKCTLDCKNGCRCKDTFVRNSKGKCVKYDSCRTHPIDSPFQCLEGDILYHNGDSTGFIGETCIDSDRIRGWEGICRNGKISQEPFIGSCASLAAEFHCCQSGNPGTLGAATCITGVCERSFSQCKENEHYTDCHSSSCWEGNCNNPVVGPMCTADCKSGCRCNDNFVRNSDGKCVKYDSCENQISSQSCLIDDILYRNGESTGFIGETCMDIVKFSGSQGVCRNGEIIQELYIGSCASVGAEFYCCQSGKPGTLGAATCITGVCESSFSQCKENEHYTDCHSSSCWEGTCNNPIVGPGCTLDCKSGCRCNDNFVRNSDGKCVKYDSCKNQISSQSCLIGDILYQNGDNTGFIGETCIDNIQFSGSQGVCRNGEIIQELYIGSCTSVGEGFYCCQSAEPGSPGAAICIDGPCDIPFSQCKENEQYTDCHSSSCWEGTCDHPIVGPMCTMDCASGCRCMDDFVRNSDGKCVTYDSCTKSIISSEKCISGHTMQRIDDSSGSIAEECLNNDLFNGTCLTNSYVAEQYTGSCTSYIPGSHCCQITTPGVWGAAICTKNSCELYKRP